MMKLVWNTMRATWRAVITTRLMRVALGFLALSVVAGASAAEDEFRRLGVYVKADDGYVQAKSMSDLYGLGYDFGRYLMGFPEAVGDADELTVVIHNRDFHPDWARYEVRDMESPGAGAAISPVTFDELDEHKYRLVFEVDDRSQHFLLVDLGCCRGNVHGISLTDTREAIADIFADESQNPVSVKYVLDNMLRGAPEDEQLLDLRARWEAVADARDAASLYERIREQWQAYESADEPTARVQALQLVVNLGAQYAQYHADGEDRESVDSLVAEAEDKLDI